MSSHRRPKRQVQIHVDVRGHLGWSIVPTGTMISPIGSVVFSRPVMVLSDHPWTRSPVAVIRIPLLSMRKLPARVYSDVVASVGGPDWRAFCRTPDYKNPSP